MRSWYLDSDHLCLRIALLISQLWSPMSENCALDISIMITYVWELRFWYLNYDHLYLGITLLIFDILITYVWELSSWYLDSDHLCLKLVYLTVAPIWPPWPWLIFFSCLSSPNATGQNIHKIRINKKKSGYQRIKYQIIVEHFERFW